MQPDEQETYDASDAASVKSARKKARHEAAKRAEIIKGLMSTPQNRKWFYDLLVKCHIYTNPHTHDALQTSFNCGEMNIGQQVLAELEGSATDLYLLMIREAKPQPEPEDETV